MDQYAVACCPTSASTTKSRSRSRASMARSKWRRRRTARTAAPAAPLRIQNRNIFDVSNLDEHGRILPLDDQRRAYRARQRALAHRQLVPAEVRDLVDAARRASSRRTAPTPNSPTPRAAYDALPDATKAKLEGLIAEHSIWHSRAQARRLHGRPRTRSRRGRRRGIRWCGTHPGSRPQGALHRLACLAHRRLAGRGRPRAARAN